MAAISVSEYQYLKLTHCREQDQAAGRHERSSRMSRSTIMQSVQKANDDFLHYCRHEKKLSDKTLKAYGIDLKQFIEYLGRNHQQLELVNIDKNILGDYLEELDSGVKPKTIKRKVATLRAFFNFLEFSEKIVVSPLRKIKVEIKQEKVAPSLLSIGDLELLFKHLYEQRDTLKRTSLFACKVLIRDIAIFELLLSTGMRVSELSDLKKSDINLETNTIKIRGTGNRARTIPILSEKTQAALNHYSSTFQHDLKNKDFFFINKHNRKISDQSIRILVEKYTAKAGITQKITPHTFRHTLHQMLMESGLDMRYIQQFMGHSSLSSPLVFSQDDREMQKRMLAERHPREKVLAG
ncbi:tyrosine-type recombinase/integrase [Acanthopleuribacter pedis]|uniref:Tyrosine-type recombinase/integrase n=1 Tax=Acanthopleuribacter pedis TaxID=442870 RepID=A0A8J7PZF4_9BACT|nr:tyrosine-type recombinase/integrase [Acanthopleuribacter pedis]MBO1317542.1 tyrosine-type recombinase/integrase [Acanthopleuribacter pedis]